MKSVRVVLLFIMVVLIVAIAITACKEKRVPKSFVNEELSDEFCLSQEYEEDRDNCLIELAKQNEIVEFCKSINSAKPRATCIFEIAKKTDNKDLCDDITLYSIKTQCKDFFP